LDDKWRWTIADSNAYCYTNAKANTAASPYGSSAAHTRLGLFCADNGLFVTAQKCRRRIYPFSGVGDTCVTFFAKIKRLGSSCAEKFCLPFLETPAQYP
jgi:hypothetical protein